MKNSHWITSLTSTCSNGVCPGDACIIKRSSFLSACKSVSLAFLISSICRACSSLSASLSASHVAICSFSWSNDPMSSRWSWCCCSAIRICSWRSAFSNCLRVGFLARYPLPCNLIDLHAVTALYAFWKNSFFSFWVMKFPSALDSASEIRLLAFSYNLQGTDGWVSSIRYCMHYLLLWTVSYEPNSHRHP